MTKPRRKRGAPVTSIALNQRHATPIGALAAAGLAISIYLTYVSHRVQADPGWQSICAISSTLNCDTVVSSPYGTFLDAPLSAYGAWFYAATFALSLVGLRGYARRFPRSPALLLFFAAAASLLLSFILALISVVWIRSLCVLCAALYFVNLGIFLVAWRALRATGERLPQAVAAEWVHARRYPAQTAGSVGGALVVGLILWAYSRPATSRAVICDILADPAFTPPLTVVIYSDFQCPHCRALDRSLRALRDRSGLRIVARHYPLDSVCNPQVTRSRHPGACVQARAAICAGDQGRYNDFSDRLFDDGPADATALVTLAASLGLNRSRFETCLWSQRTGDELAASIREAVAAGARGTPTVLVNGRRHAGSFSSKEISCLERVGRSALHGGEGLSHGANP